MSDFNHFHTCKAKTGFTECWGGLPIPSPKSCPLEQHAADEYDPNFPLSAIQFTPLAKLSALLQQPKF